MPPAPTLSEYESQATSEYAPQESSALTTQGATHQANLNTLNTNLNDVGAQYDIQEEQLGSSVQQEAGQIAQTYATSLLGNTSGLQGNDMGEMFSNANLQEQSIETQRTNAINSINTSITNEDLTNNADTEAIQSQYAGEEASAADTAYNDAVSEYNTEEYQQQELGLEQEKIDVSETNTANTEANTLANSYSATGKTAYDSTSNTNVASTSNGYDFKGPNGTPVNMASYITGAQGMTSGFSPTASAQAQVIDLLQNGSATDKAVLAKVGNISNPTQFFNALGGTLKISVNGKTQNFNAGQVYGF